jgi:macrolide-specific efflux system membrane fusion protein
MKKKNMKRLVYVIIVLVVLGAAWSAWSYFKSDAASDMAGKAAEVKLGSIQSIVTAQGTLQPRYYVDVGAQISGTVEVMHVDIGDHVKTGDLIAEIDPAIYEAQVRATEARLNQLQAQKTEQEALIKQAEWKYERYRNLYNDQAVSKEVMQDTEISLEVAKAKLLSLEAQIQETRSQLDGEKANLNYTKIYAPMDRRSTQTRRPRR